MAPCNSTVKMWEHRRIRKTRRPSIMPDQPTITSTTDINILTIDELKKSVTELWRNDVSEEDFNDICDILHLPAQFKCNQVQFHGFLAFSERYMFNKQITSQYLMSSTQHIEDFKFSMLNDQERIDFSSLQKFIQFNVNSRLLDFFKFIRQLDLRK